MPQKAKKHVHTDAPHFHASHPKTLSRLKIASGHLIKVVKMVEEDKECLAILQQLSAVISALEASRVTLLQDHFTSCIAPELPERSKHLVQDLEIILERALK